MRKDGFNMAISPKSGPVAFAELHCKSNYSFLRGASHPEELVSRAKELGYEAIAITDECSLSGIVRAHVEAEKGWDQADRRGGVSCPCGKRKKTCWK